MDSSLSIKVEFKYIISSISNKFSEGGSFGQK